MVDSFSSQVGYKIREIRKSKKISMERLAELSNLHETYISRIELGKHSVSIEVIKKIASGLGVKPFEIVQISVTEQEKAIERVVETLKKYRTQEIKTINTLLETYLMDVSVNK